MDYCPCLFTQNDLYWLDNLMPDRVKSGKKKRNNPSEAVKIFRSKEKIIHSILLMFQSNDKIEEGAEKVTLLKSSSNGNVKFAEIHTLKETNA